MIKKQNLKLLFTILFLSLILWAGQVSARELKRTPLITEDEILFASDYNPINYFAKAIDIDGDTAVIGANQALSGGSGIPAGAAYIFEWDGTAWVEQQKLSPSNPTCSPFCSGFGRNAAIDGDTIVIGARRETHAAGVEAGAAYVYTRDGAGVWSEQQRLVPADSETHDFFGLSVDVQGDYIAVGSLAGGTGDLGSIYLFRRHGNVWYEQEELDAWLYDAAGSFGFSVLFHENLLIAGDGAQGHIFDRVSISAANDDTITNQEYWVYRQNLVSSEAGIPYSFGSALAADGDTIVVGDWGNDTAGTKSGAVFIFTRHNGVWSEQHVLRPTNTLINAQFGSAVDIEGDVLVIGAQKDNEANANDGAAFIFTRTDAGTTDERWTEQQKLVRSDASDGVAAFLGYSIALEGNSILVGAPWRAWAGDAGVGGVHVYYHSFAAPPEPVWVRPLRPR